MLIIDGVKYKLWKPKDEEGEFHPMVKKHSKEIFGEDSIYFDIKHKLTSKSGIAAVPDAYVITLSKPYEWYIVENELASHPVYSHIVPQISKFVDNVEELETQRDIRDIFDKEVNEDVVLKALIEKKTGQNSYRFLTELVSKQPKIALIIDEITPEVKKASKSLRKLADTKIVEFKTFVREDAPNVKAHLFVPLYAKEIIKEKRGERIEEQIETAKSEEVKRLIRESLDQLKQKNCIIKPLKGRWMSVWVKQRRFMYIAVRNKWFLCQIKKSDGSWTDSLRIANRKEWENVFQSYIQPILNSVQ